MVVVAAGAGVVVGMHWLPSCVQAMLSPGTARVCWVVVVVVVVVGVECKSQNSSCSKKSRACQLIISVHLMILIFVNRYDDIFVEGA